MKAFNLAESRIAERDYYRQCLSKKIKVIAALICATIIVVGVCYSCKARITGNSTNLKSQLADVQGRCIEIKKELDSIKIKSNQREWQKQLADGSKQTIGVLGCVLKNAPDDVWLSRVESSTQNSSITVAGHSTSYESLYDYLTRLKSSKQFAEIRLDNSCASSVNGISFIDFDLHIKLKGAGMTQQPAQPTQPAGVPPVQEST